MERASALSLAMRSFFTQKPGKIKCSFCSGVGCWHCARKGFNINCPSCGSSDEITESSELFTCEVCGTSFDKAGSIVIHED